MSASNYPCDVWWSHDFFNRYCYHHQRTIFKSLHFVPLLWNSTCPEESHLSSNTVSCFIRNSFSCHGDVGFGKNLPSSVADQDFKTWDLIQRWNRLFCPLHQEIDFFVSGSKPWGRVQTNPLDPLIFLRLPRLNYCFVFRLFNSPKKLTGYLGIHLQANQSVASTRNFASLNLVSQFHAHCIYCNLM